MRYILLNFAYGYGAFLRTMEIAFETGELLFKRTGERYGLIVPLVYGEKQKAIIREVFPGLLPQEFRALIFDNTLGGILRAIFYGDLSYENSLKKYLQDKETVEQKAQNYLRNKYKDKIALSINRCPRMDFESGPAYYNSFAFISEILERASTTDEIKFDKTLLKQAAARYAQIEKNHRLHFVAEPGTFGNPSSFSPLRRDRLITTPPHLRPAPTPDCQNLRPGIYITVSGISNLEHLYQNIHNDGLIVYTNRPEKIPNSAKASPRIIGCPEIKLHFARSGWGSIWQSFLSETPFIALPYEAKDDPEIYFNNLALEKLGIGKIYRGESVEELLEFAKVYKQNVQKTKQGLLNKYGTLDGITYTAERIVEDYLSLSLPPLGGEELKVRGKEII